MGITPAGAGKTWTMEHLPELDEDHPRRCGENDDGDISRLRDIGSPPQVRGKLYCVCFGSGGLRITPAGAGKTIGKIGNTFCTPDHPRRCGENSWSAVYVRCL